MQNVQPEVQNAEMIGTDIIDDLDLAEAAADTTTADLGLRVQISFPGLEVDIPFHPTTYQSTLKNGQPVTEAVRPAWVTNLAKLLASPKSRRLAQSFHVSALREILIKAQPALEVRAFQGNIILHGGLPRNVFVVTDEFIYVPVGYVETTGVKWDFDGDGLAMAFDPAEVPKVMALKGIPGQYAFRRGVPIKDPVTRAIEPVWFTQDESLLANLQSPLWDFTKSEREAWEERDALLRGKELAARGQMTEAEAIFRKAHDLPRVGMIDGLVKNHALYASQGMALREKQLALYTDGVAFECLENGALGAVRKDHLIGDVETQKALQAVESLSVKVPEAYGPFLTNTSGIGSIQASKLGWVDHLDLEKHIQAITQLEIKDWVERKAPPTGGQDVERRVYSNEIVKAMLDGGMLQIQEIPHGLNHVGARNALMVRILNKNGQPVALTDVRKSQGVAEGLTWGFILPPVWDVEEGKWVRPLKHLHKMLQLVTQVYQVEGAETEVPVQGFDARIINPETGEHTRTWGSRGIRDLWDPKHAYKLGELMKFISAYVGQYGLILPGAVKDGHVEWGEFNLKVAARTAVVDYGLAEYEVDRWWNEFQPLVGQLCPASKGDDRRVRKHAMTAQLGSLLPWWAEGTTANPRRAGQMLSQLSRAHKAMPLTVAIILPTPLLQDVQGGNPEQTLITPSGVLKQKLDGLLGGSVFSQRLSHQPHPDFQEQVEFEDLRGEKRVAWMRGAKGSKLIGKLIDGLGNKFMNMPTQQWAFSVRNERMRDIKPGSIVEIHSPNHQGNPLVDSIIHVQEVSDTHVLGTDDTGRRVKVDRTAIMVRKVQTLNVDLLIPVQELINKGLLEHYMAQATQRVLIGERGEKIVAWVVEDSVWYRTSTPTENMRTRIVRRRIRGLNAHLVIAGILRARKRDLERFGLSGSFRDLPKIESKGLAYANQLKDAMHNILRWIGHGDLIPPPGQTQKTWEEATGQQNGQLISAEEAIRQFEQLAKKVESR